MLGTGDVARGVGRPSGHADYYRPAPSGARCTPARLPHFHHCCLARSHRAGAGASHLVLLILNNSPDLEAEALKGVRDGAAVAARLKACLTPGAPSAAFVEASSPSFLYALRFLQRRLRTRRVPLMPTAIRSFMYTRMIPVHSRKVWFTWMVTYTKAPASRAGPRYGWLIYQPDGLQRYDLPTEYFGEGLTTWGANLIQLTWKRRRASFMIASASHCGALFHYQAEGWGLTHDEKELILGDGTSVLRFLDPTSFREIKRLSVHDDKGQPLKNLNELEYIHGEIYANIWQTDQIVRISPHTGKVLGWIDLSGLMDKRQRADPDAVLNGIAYDSKRGQTFSLPGSCAEVVRDSSGS